MHNVNDNVCIWTFKGILGNLHIYLSISNPPNIISMGQSKSNKSYETTAISTYLPPLIMLFQSLTLIKRLVKKIKN